MEKLRTFLIEPSNGLWGLYNAGEKDNLKKELQRYKKPKKFYEGTQIIVLNTTNECNLNCVYCSAREVRSMIKMPLEIAKKSLERAIEGKYIPEIVFHGSEPTLNMDLIVGTVNYGRELEKASGRKLEFYLQTNLAHLDNIALKFIHQNRIAVSTSMDGTRDIHNASRPYSNGKPSYDDVKNNINRVLEVQDGICAICVVTKDNVHHLNEIVYNFEEIGITDIQLLPSVRCSKNGADFAPKCEDITENYLEVFDTTFSKMINGKQKINVRNIKQYLKTFFFESGIDSCRICSSSPYHPLLAVDTDGDVYPCDFFWGDKRKVVGNVLIDSFESMLNHPNNPRMIPIERTDCSECDWRNLCGGGCMADRLFNGGKPDYCEMHKSIYSYLSKKIPELIKNGLLKKIMLD